MMLALPPHIHLAVLGDDVVILDVAADAYLCVPGGRRTLCPNDARSAVDPPDAQVRARLLDAGVAAAAAAGGPCVPRARPPPPACDVGGPSEAAPSLVELLRLAGAMWDLAWLYRGRPLRRILAIAARGGAAVPEPDAAEAARLARLFQRVAVWLPMPRKCLVRSFVLLRFLQRSGTGACWVFGVTTWPFRAHCWLQVGDLVLDDWADRLAAYEPILAVG